MAFTAKDVQTLRERTGCGMMDCKKALTESGGDMDKAIELLREKGLAAAAKKAGRIAAEGVVYALVSACGNQGVVIEVNAETDFVAKNDSFMGFVDNAAKAVLVNNPADVDALMVCKDETGMTIEEQLRDKILTIGENMKVRRFTRYEGVLTTYVHGGGRIGVMVKFDTTPEIAGTEKFKEYAKDVALQIAAVNPAYLNRDQVPSEILDKEKEILTAQAINEGKPANIAEKMVAGRIAKYYKENCLVDQVFIKDDSLSVSNYTANVAKELGGNISIVEFVRFEKGEGIEKKEDNFADEVANMVK